MSPLVLLLCLVIRSEEVSFTNPILDTDHPDPGVVLLHDGTAYLAVLSSGESPDTFPLMESRAITALRTGNLMFKNWTPWRFSIKNAGDKRCMFPACQEDDTLKHVLRCEYYSTKFVEKESPLKDWAVFLVQLDKERMEKFHQPLISCDGWSKKEY